MGPWVIQALTHNDIDDVLAIEEAAFTSPWTRAMYLAELQNSGVSYCFLARNAGGRGVGFCSFWRIVDELHINNLAVLPELRRQGLGSVLLDDNGAMVVDVTNADLRTDNGRVWLHRESVHLSRVKFLKDNASFERVRLRSYVASGLLAARKNLRRP